MVTATMLNIRNYVDVEFHVSFWRHFVKTILDLAYFYIRNIFLRSVLGAMWAKTRGSSMKMVHFPPAVSSSSSCPDGTVASASLLLQVGVSALPGARGRSHSRRRSPRATSAARRRATAPSSPGPATTGQSCRGREAARAAARTGTSR